MKRVKLMLMSLLVLAVVGGALAFKARFTAQYCSTAAVQGACPVNITCPNYTTSSIVIGGDDFCTTVPFATTVIDDKCKVNPAAGNNAIRKCVTPTAYDLDGDD